ncbi:hypothetical protein bthur0007_65540 [Bacillus thuringiensis serovar monterrey BGSC 4AJ1]|nr:hypothetical protein bthur0007_65540 [Bacillus thuringiensis serovar monterrey BGSC 4AJ1]
MKKMDSVHDKYINKNQYFGGGFNVYLFLRTDKQATFIFLH